MDIGFLRETELMGQKHSWSPDGYRWEIPFSARRQDLLQRHGLRHVPGPYQSKLRLEEIFYFAPV